MAMATGFKVSRNDGQVKEEGRCISIHDRRLIAARREYYLVYALCCDERELVNWFTDRQWPLVPEWIRYAPTGNVDHRPVGFIRFRVCGLRGVTSTVSRLSSMMAILWAGALWSGWSNDPVSTYSERGL